MHRASRGLWITAVVVGTGLTGCPQPLEQIPLAGLEPLGIVELAPELRFEQTPIGGLSGLVWLGRGSEFLAISDDPSQRAPARWYRLRIDLADGRLDPGDVAVVGMATLKDRDGRAFPELGLDSEGIALGGRSLFVSSEGQEQSGRPPFIASAGMDGRIRSYWPLPDRYLPQSGVRGVRRNLGFESLAVAPDGRYLFAAVENALVQDGAAADAGIPSPARILRFGIDRDAPAGRPEEFAYAVEAVSGAPAEGVFRINSLCDLVALSAERLLALERQYVTGDGYQARLYLVDLSGATDVSQVDGLERPGIAFAAKRLVADLGRLGVALDNLEGMALGPRLSDGRRSLVLISDDNFDAERQRTQIIAFALDPTPAAIGAIQGAAHRSPREGSWIFGVEGVVTAVSSAPGLEGFWIESERPDQDPATSEGVFVAWQGQPVSPGQLVVVDAHVRETAASSELSVTRLEAESLMRRPGAGQLGPPRRLFAQRRAPSVIEDDGLARFDPDDDAIDLWESVEGMRVEVGPGVVTGATTRYGELVLLPDGAPPGPRSAAGGALRTADGAPLERAILSGRLLGGLPDLNVGTRIARPVAGIVDYSFSNYKLLALEPLEAHPDPQSCSDRSKLRSDPEHLTIATFNVENLSASGPASRFERLGRVIAGPLGGPALLALQEIQDDSGPADDQVVGARATVAALVAAIAAAGGPSYQSVWIDPERGREGGQPGGNIRVALLADPTRARIVRRGSAAALDAAALVQGARGPYLSMSPARVAPASAAFTLEHGEGVRRSLAVELEVGGRPLFLVVNHLSSKYEDDRDFGATQPPRRPTGARRLAQAEVIRSWAEQLLRLDPAARLVVLGDLNDFEWSPAVRRLAAPPFENLIWRVPTPQRYTFVFEGAAQALDHVIVSPALVRDAVVDVVHLNADCAERQRSSDHDPVLVRLAVAGQ